MIWRTGRHTPKKNSQEYPTPPGTFSHDVLVKGAKTGNHLERRIPGWMNEEGGGKEGGMDGGME